MVQVDLTLAERFNWSLYELDLTDIESLFPFWFAFVEKSSQAGIGARPAPRKAYCDQVDWL